MTLSGSFPFWCGSLACRPRSKFEELRGRRLGETLNDWELISLYRLLESASTAATALVNLEWGPVTAFFTWSGRRSIQKKEPSTWPCARKS
jgi:hypothetical protein